MFTLGFVSLGGRSGAAVDVVAAAFGLFVIAAQIGYLPTLYGAFNRRETEITRLGSRAGTPPWDQSCLPVRSTESARAMTTSRSCMQRGSDGRPTLRRVAPTTRC
jgi:hypothetical protein